MRIAIIGKGGREAAISWKLALSPKVKQIVVLPGNVGMLSPKTICQNFQTTNELIEILKTEKFDICVVGQEKYLEQGLIDQLMQLNIPCVGPVQAAAQLESSKLFCKEIFMAADVPTAGYKYFSSSEALKNFCLKEIEARPLVLKWDYLAEGKGVFVCFDRSAVEKAIIGLNELATLQGKYSVVVEDYLEGREFSAFCLVDSDSVRYFSSACDYKRLTSDPKSPNTGGMGTYSPADVLASGEKTLVEDYSKRIVKALKQKGIIFNGVMFLGCLQVKDTTYLLEVNTRFGDPETQSLLPRLETDLADIFLTMSKRQGLLESIEIKWSNSCAVHVVKADPDYPTAKKSHVKIQTEKNSEVTVFFAGVEERADGLSTNGGRVLGITALGSTKESAKDRVYKNINAAQFENEYYRKDIGC